MGKKKLSDEKIKEICKLYKENHILSTELGIMFGIDENTVLRYLKANDVVIKTKTIPGDQFGKWTVIEETKKIKGLVYFLCECSCPDKTRKEVRQSMLKNGNSQSCGCFQKERDRETLINTGKDYTGQTFGKLTVLYEVERSKHGNGK